MANRAVHDWDPHVFYLILRGSGAPHRFARLIILLLVLVFYGSHTDGLSGAPFNAFASSTEKTDVVVTIITTAVARLCSPSFSGQLDFPPESDPVRQKNYFQNTSTFGRGTNGETRTKCRRSKSPTVFKTSERDAVVGG